MSGPPTSGPPGWVPPAPEPGYGAPPPGYPPLDGPPTLGQPTLGQPTLGQPEMGQPPTGGIPPYPMPAYLQTPPPPRQRKGLVLGLVIGAAVLVLLLCVAVVPFALRSGSSGHSAAGGRAGATTAAPSPTPTARTVSAQEYASSLSLADQELGPMVAAVGAATDSTSLAGNAQSLRDDLQKWAEDFDGMAPPDSVRAVNGELTFVLNGLASVADDIATSSTSGELCTGYPGLSRLTHSDASVKFRSVVKDLASIDPTYVFGAFLPAPTGGPSRRLGNGTQIKKASGGLGQLKLNNHGTRDTVVTLAPTGTTTATLSVYVQAGANTTVHNIRDGTYDVYELSGDDWDGALKQFTANCHASKSDGTMNFKTTRTTYSIWTFDLAPATGGNTPLTPVSPGGIPT